MNRDECPVCEDKEYKRLNNGTPYVECMKCDFWYQTQVPEKLYEGVHEASGETMSQHERRVNLSLACTLYGSFLHDKQHSRALDIGAKFPWLMHCLSGVSGGKVESWAIDGIPAIEEFVKKFELKVNGHQCDFETTARKDFPWKDLKFDLITMVHIIEHFYYPVETLAKVYDLLAPGGKVFIRCPAHDVEGIERDFTEGHFSIHPQIWGKRSLEYLANTLSFRILMNNETRPGQRDLVLVKGDQ